MLNVTERAQEKIAQYFEKTAIRPIRVFLNNSCGGPHIALALDDARADDSTFEYAGIQYLVNKSFLEQAQPIEIDFTDQGFKVTSTLALGDGCGGCGSSNSCCH